MCYTKRLELSIVNAVQHTRDCSRLTIVLLVRYAVTHCDVWNVERVSPLLRGKAENERSFLRSQSTMRVQDRPTVVSIAKGGIEHHARTMIFA